jgi:hypothetical protein
MAGLTQKGGRFWSYPRYQSGSRDGIDFPDPLEYLVGFIITPPSAHNERVVERKSSEMR